MYRSQLPLQAPPFLLQIGKSLEGAGRDRWPGAIDDVEQVPRLLE